VVAEHIDTLVLGCTHYPLLKALFEDILEPVIRLVDSAEAMAAITAELLATRNLSNPLRIPPQYQFFVTDVPYRFQTIGERFLGRSLSHVDVVRL
jgi:glutamate racemase